MNFRVGKFVFWWKFEENLVELGFNSHLFLNLFVDLFPIFEFCGAKFSVFIV